LFTHLIPANWDFAAFDLPVIFPEKTRKNGVRALAGCITNLFTHLIPANWDCAAFDLPAIFPEKTRKNGVRALKKSSGFSED